jgi:hypothetical protein
VCEDSRSLCPDEQQGLTGPQWGVLSTAEGDVTTLSSQWWLLRLHSGRLSGSTQPKAAEDTLALLSLCLTALIIAYCVLGQRVDRTYASLHCLLLYQCPPLQMRFGRFTNHKIAQLSFSEGFINCKVYIAILY